jgi:hypothetical protein
MHELVVSVRVILLIFNILIVTLSWRVYTHHGLSLFQYNIKRFDIFVFRFFLGLHSCHHKCLLLIAENIVHELQVVLTANLPKDVHTDLQSPAFYILSFTIEQLCQTLHYFLKRLRFELCY